MIYFNVNYKEESELDPQGAPKKTKQNKIRTCKLTVSIFIAEVINILHRI